MTASSSRLSPDPCRRQADVRRRWLRRSAAALTVGLLLAGCSEPAADGPGPAGSPAAGPAGTSAAAVEACALLTADEVTAVIGRHPGGVPSTGGCVWENPETHHSVTLGVGEPGTAVEGRLPTEDPAFGKPEQGPDGIRFVRSNTAEFAVGDRYCELVVVTSVTDDSDRPALVRLAGLVRGRL